MRVALISSLTSATGNAVTAQRLADHLRLGGEHTVELWDIKDLDRCSGEEVKERLARERVDAVLAIHAWRAGRHLLLSSVPFVLVFGGTDLNEHAQQSGKLATMTNVVRRASFVVAFSTTMEQKALSLWGKDVRSKLVCIAPAVAVEQFTDTTLSSSSSFSSTSNNQEDSREEVVCPELLASCLPSLRPFVIDAAANGESGKEDGPRRSVFLLPSGLRAVKDPLFLLDAFCAWHDEEKEVRGREVFLLIIGPVLDEQYGDAVLRKVESLRGIIYHPSIPRQLLHLLVMKSIAVVNSSRSEGLSNVLVEAMLLGTPVVARRIQGNESVIEHETTGLLFDTPHDFVTYAKRLLDSSDLRKALSSRAKAHANEKYSLENEGRAYRSLFSRLRSAQAHPIGSSL